MKWEKEPNKQWLLGKNIHGQYFGESSYNLYMVPKPSENPSCNAAANAIYFYKDGRRINIGDCALFQAGNALPLIGIIRALTTKKKGNLIVVISRFYRPAEIKLAKGVLVDAAPNEIFYSFYVDEISATLLYHPCKIAFLPKGVELPSTVSSFVCRRAYDISTESIYWLTDQDCLHEHVDEINKLLDNTRHKMQRGIQSKLSSSKAAVQTTSQQLPKAKSDVMEKSSISSQGKGKKRRGADQTLDPRKRERSAKSDDSDASQLMRELCVMPEKLSGFIHNNGSLMVLSTVDQLIQFMQQEKNDSEINKDDIVSCRTMLASMIAATEKEECLDRFVQLGGLPILENWLQETHKEKNGDGVIQRGLEELLLMLLRALSKLPVNLDALKTCSIGKSVNNLRSHKSTEIQRKARKLVDTWKRRVDAEMKMSDESKSTSNSTMSWSYKGSCSDHTDVKAVTTSESKLKSMFAVMRMPKDSLEISASNSACSEIIPPSTDGSEKNHTKLQIAMVTGDIPLASVKEERNSSSSISQNNSQSLSNATDPTGSNKRVEGAGACSIKQSYSIGSSSCSTGMQEDLLVSKPQQAHCQTEVEEVGSLLHGVQADDVSNQRLIVQLSNIDRSPAAYDVQLTSRDTCPGTSERHTLVDSKKSNTNNGIYSTQSPEVITEGKCRDSRHSKLELCCAIDNERSHDFAAGDYGDGKFSGGEDTLKVESDEAGKSVAVAASYKLRENVLEKLQASTDECGIHLLASVAANASSEDATFVRIKPDEQIGISKEYHDRDLKIQRKNDTDSLHNGDEDENSSGTTLAEAMKDKHADCSSDSHCTPTVLSCLEPVASYLEASFVQEVTKGHDTGPIDFITCQEQSIAKSRNATPTNESELSPKSLHECENFKVEIADHVESPVDDSFRKRISEDGKRVDTSCDILSMISLTKDVAKTETEYAYEDALEVARQVAKEVEEEVQQYRMLDQQVDPGVITKIDEREEYSSIGSKRNTLSSTSEANEAAKDKTVDQSQLHATDHDTLLHSYGSQETVTGRREDIEAERRMGPGESEVNQAAGVSGCSYEPKSEVDQVDPVLGSVVDACEEERRIVSANSDVQLENIINVNEFNEQIVRHPTVVLQNSRQKSCDINVTDTSSKPCFDLNERLAFEEVASDIALPNAIHSMSFPVIPIASVPYPVSLQCPTATSLTVPVSVVAAMKGAIIPPNPSRANGEPGWKGSAATSAFRPAEPRHTQLHAVKSGLGSGKQSQPLDIDLNVADESLLEDGGVVALESSEGSASGLPFKSSVVSLTGITEREGNPGIRCNSNRHQTTLGRMLDLNQVDELLDSEFSEALVQMPSDNLRRVIREFDLNDGPVLDDDVGIEPSVQPSISNITTASKSEPGYVNTTAWCRGNTFPMLALPVFSAARPESEKSINAPMGISFLNAGSVRNPFSNDIYASTAKLPPSASYLPPTLSYPNTIFGSIFPPTSSFFTTGSTIYQDSAIPSCFPTVLPVASAGMPSGWPLVNSVSENAGVEATPWARTKFDLNTGPDHVDANDGDGLSHHIFFPVHQAMKRKYPEGGLDSDGPSFKQMWQ